MMSFKIRLLSLAIRLLVSYQQHLEMKRWLKQQRQQAWHVTGISAHIAKDIGVDADGRIRGKVAVTEAKLSQHSEPRQTWAEHQQGLTADT